MNLFCVFNHLPQKAKAIMSLPVSVWAHLSVVLAKYLMMGSLLECVAHYWMHLQLIERQHDSRWPPQQIHFSKQEELYFKMWGQRIIPKTDLNRSSSSPSKPKSTVLDFFLYSIHCNKVLWHLIIWINQQANTQFIYFFITEQLSVSSGFFIFFSSSHQNFQQP